MVYIRVYPQFGSEVGVSYKDCKFTYFPTIDAKEINDYFNKKKSSRNKAIISGIVGGVFTSLGLKFLFFDRINKEKDGIIISSNRGELNITFLF